MPSPQAKRIERELVNAHVGALFSDDLMRPDLDRCLANVPATVAALLGKQVEGMRPALPDPYWRPLAGDVRRVIVVLLDALGYRQLGRLFADGQGGPWQRLARNGLLLPMTSILPSTTNAALSTLATGRMPLSHGMFAYEMWLREYGVLTQMLAFVPVYGGGSGSLIEWGLEPERFLAVPGVGEWFREEGIATRALVAGRFAQSALTRACYRGFDEIIGYLNADDMWAHMRHAIQRDEAERSYDFVYWGGVDAAMHQHGEADDYWGTQYRGVTASFEREFLARLRPEDREGTVLIMLADHGFVETPMSRIHTVSENRVLGEALAIPCSGESRAAFLHCRDGGREATRRRIADSLGEGFCVAPTEEVVRAGLFGTGAPCPEAASRLGNLIVAARGQHALDRSPTRRGPRGRHGGLTPEEMLVPWLAARLDG